LANVKLLLFCNTQSQALGVNLSIKYNDSCKYPLGKAKMDCFYAKDEIGFAFEWEKLPKLQPVFDPPYFKRASAQNSDLQPQKL
jgi:hypothetical protein